MLQSIVAVMLGFGTAAFVSYLLERDVIKGNDRITGSLIVVLNFCGGWWNLFAFLGQS